LQDRDGSRCFLSNNFDPETPVLGTVFLFARTSAKIAAMSRTVLAALFLFPSIVYGAFDELYVINTKPPSIAVVDNASLKLISDINLPGMPSYLQVGVDGAYLYVLVNGTVTLDGRRSNAASEIDVIDVRRREIVGKIDAGWNVSTMTLSKNRQDLVTFATGRLMDKRMPAQPSVVTLIDTKTNSVGAKIEIPELAKQLLFTQDITRIAVLTAKSVYVFDTARPGKALAVVAGEFLEMAMSDDDHWLYVLNRGKVSADGKYRDSNVKVMDITTGQIAVEHKVGNSPSLVQSDRAGWASILSEGTPDKSLSALYQLRGPQFRTVTVGRTDHDVRRFPDAAGTFVFGQDAVHFVPDEATDSEWQVPLTKQKTSNGQTPAVRGPIGEALYLRGQQQILLTLLKQSGKQTTGTSSVAQLNINGRRVEKVITTGRSNIKFAKGLVKFGGSMAVAELAGGIANLATPAVAYAPLPSGLLVTALVDASASLLLQPLVMDAVYGAVGTGRMPSNLTLAASADQKHTYALNRYTDDVTIVDTSNASIVDYVPCGSGCWRLLASPDDRFLMSVATKQLTWINTLSNTIESKMEFPERIHAVYTDLPTHRVFAISESTLTAFDATSGRRVGKIEDLKGPKALVIPTH
jgi:DNA-binding beta-propeller fold protein YncE